MLFTSKHIFDSSFNKETQGFSGVNLVRDSISDLPVKTCEGNVKGFIGKAIGKVIS